MMVVEVQDGVTCPWWWYEGKVRGVSLVVVVVVKEGEADLFPYSCGWVLYILFYLHLLYSCSHT